MHEHLKDMAARIASPLKPGRQKRRKIILHIGPHRTGTTTTQAMLEKNRDVLPEWVAVLTRADEAQAEVSRLMRGARTLNGAQKRAPLARTAAALVAKRCKADVTIVSDEDLLGALPTRYNVTGLYPFLETLLPAAIEGYASRGAEVTVAWSVRHFPDWLESVYHRRYNFDPPTAFRFRRYRIWYEMPNSWRLFVPRLAAACGEAEVAQMVFAKDVKARFMGRQLLRLAGLTDDELTPIQRPRALNVAKSRRDGRPPVHLSPAKARHQQEAVENAQP